MTCSRVLGWHGLSGCAGCTAGIPDRHVGHMAAAWDGGRRAGLVGLAQAGAHKAGAGWAAAQDQHPAAAADLRMAGAAAAATSAAGGGGRRVVVDGAVRERLQSKVEEEGQRSAAADCP